MLNQLKTQHREVARLAFEGFRAVEISTKTSLAISTVRSILCDPLCKAYIANLDEAASDNVIDVRKRLSTMNVKALDVIDDMLSLEVPPAVALRAAHDILDRTGYQPVQQHQHLHTHLTKSDVEEIKKRAKAAQQPRICNTEPEVSPEILIEPPQPLEVA